MGLNPYMTPYQYWRVKKMETLETAAEEDNDSMIRGRFKEDAIARMFEQATGEKIVKRSEQIEVYRNDKYPSYMQAAPDREVFAAGRSTRYILECKDTKMHLPELTPETVPMLWYTQIIVPNGDHGTRCGVHSRGGGRQAASVCAIRFRPIQICLYRGVLPGMV
jgi:predicted phage-related endonuclease